MDTVSTDILLYLLDQDPNGTVQGLVDAKNELGLALCLTYGKDIPQGRQWGSRVQRRQWLTSERAKRVRLDAAEASVRILETKKDLMRFYRQVRRLRGYGPVLKYVIREWNDRNTVQGVMA